MSNDKSKFFDVIFYIYNTDINVMGPYLYSFQIWQKRGYNVKVFYLHDERKNGSIQVSFSERFSNYSVKFPLFIRLLENITKLRGGRVTNMIKMFYFVIFCFIHTNKQERHILIAADPPSLWAAALVSKKTKSPYIYFIKELFLSDDVKNIIDGLIKNLERKANKNALYTVEFDQTRADLLANDNGLSHKSIIVIPNAPIGQATNEHSSYLREKFNIPDDKKIALYTGGIADYNLTYEHIESTDNWPDNVVLVMHCWSSTEKIIKLKEYAKQFKSEIYFSTEMLPFGEIHKLYSSADIGFSLYGSQDLNHKYTGLASGKMFNFMKASVPIITNNTPSCKKAIEETGCGVCISTIDEVGNAIRKILKSEDDFRLNCLKYFHNYSFEINYQKLINSIEDIY